MPQRANVFAIHSWQDAASCRRMEQLLRESDPGLAHYSVPPERAVEGSPSRVAESIEKRIAVSTAVLVVNTEGLHRRATARFEMETAVRMKKRIVVVQPHGRFDLPVPAVLDGHVYRHAGWRSDVVGRAIRGEYPHDGRVFDTAEAADRRALATQLGAGIAASSFLMLARVARDWQLLQSELAQVGVDLRWNASATTCVAGYALIGGLVAGVGAGLVSGDRKTALIAGLAGAIVGSAVGARRVYRAHLLGSADLRVMSIEPMGAR